MTLRIVMPFRYNIKDNIHEWNNCPHKDLYKNVHCGFTQNSYKLKRTQRSINKWMNKQAVVYSFSGKLLNNKNEWTTYSHINTCNNMDESCRYYTKQKYPDTKEYIPHDFIYTKVIKGKNSDRNHRLQRDRRKSGWWKCSIILFVVVVTQIDISVHIHGTLHLKCVHFIACKLYLDTSDFKGKKMWAVLLSQSPEAKTFLFSTNTMN